MVKDHEMFKQVHFHMYLSLLFLLDNLISLIDLTGIFLGPSCLLAVSPTGEKHMGLLRSFHQSQTTTEGQCERQGTLSSTALRI